MRNWFEETRLFFCMTIFAMVAVVMAAGCMENVGAGQTGSGELNLAFTLPSDVDHVDVQLYAVVDAANSLVDQAVLATGELSVQFTRLKAGDYYVEAQGYDGVGMETYSGQGTVYVHPDALNNLTILWMANENSVPSTNAAPKIEYVDVDGATVPLTDLDAGADPGLYIIAPGLDESVGFTVVVSDADGDFVAIAWTVKDGPNGEDNDVGMVCGTGDTISWSHDLPGIYYVSIHISDGRGGSSIFTFELYVVAN